MHARRCATTALLALGAPVTAGGETLPLWEPGAGRGDAGAPRVPAVRGFSGWQAALDFSHAQGRWRLFGFVAPDVLRDAAFDESPLLKRRTSVIAGGGAAYVFSQSTKTTRTED